MIERSVNKHKLGAIDEQKADLLFWLSKTPAERVAAVDFLRAQHAETSKRIQRTVHIVKRAGR
ncbi:MAG TPA: hypothetical protein PKH10_10195 [bacterium]|nr:hypothetical protein [bacterium]